ncbi:LSU ribosomal protein L10P [Thermaerobacter marianensis DSM 12885]|uniref:Large ribosomal subunit protein uL10 n=1 Tax=Thermaerobacter marianensis (strain ATCC 700841 / DSM 12885 / JCM 10246 / 7p75a) TaxID=644966 RepID=E6SLE0_THEM7|nr:50S ribosomal protein L10 [Thermaerobacter marianensis]ADU52382.1 LSU ribosomal protein L10P [Thermaerobacter marianensis DSM 12885]
MLTRAEKEALVEDLVGKLQRAQGVILTDFRGLNVAATSELRRRLRAQGVEYRVIKNTLIRRAAQQAGIEGLDALLEGPTALAFGYDDPVAPAKELSRFAKEFAQLQIKGGLLQGRVIGVKEVQALADLPSREELLAKVMGGMQAPLSGLVGVLAATLRSFVYAVDALRRQREAQA